MNLIIDRFEGDVAVCQNEALETINITDYPSGAKEGDCLAFKDGKYVIDEEMTRFRREKAEKLLQSLFKK